MAIGTVLAVIAFGAVALAVLLVLASVIVGKRADTQSQMAMMRRFKGIERRENAGRRQYDDPERITRAFEDGVRTGYARHEREIVGSKIGSVLTTFDDELARASGEAVPDRHPDDRSPYGPTNA